MHFLSWVMMWSGPCVCLLLLHSDLLLVAGEAHDQVGRREGTTPWGVGRMQGQSKWEVLQGNIQDAIRLECLLSDCFLFGRLWRPPQGMNISM